MEKSEKLKLLYGEDFPGLEVFTAKNPKTDKELGAKWDQWVKGRYGEQRTLSRARNLHTSRHRHFKAGRQWISTRDGRTWREPNADKNSMRVTLNLVGPALDYRMGVLREQRPGFKYEPIGANTAARETAEAQQNVVEYYYNSQRVWIMLMDGAQAAQTDGGAFLNVFIDRNAGTETQRVELVNNSDQRYAMLIALGYTVRDDGLVELPLDEGGEIKPPGQESAVNYEGEIATRVVYSHEVLYDPEAKTINGPYDKAKWFIVRRPRDLESARIETGDHELQADIESSEDAFEGYAESVTMQYQRGIPPFPDTMIQPQKTVYEYLIYFNGNVGPFKKGAWLRLIGKTVVEAANELPGGVIPMARITDGSNDPQLLPRPQMSDWLSDQLAINALASFLVQHVRVWGSGRLIAQQDTTLNESWSTIQASVVKYQGMKPEVMSGQGAGQDAWRLLEFFVKKFEDKSGYNDLARGQVSGSGSFQDVSGRALLGARELLERTLAPMVRAAADGMTEWAELVVKYAQWLFTQPRLIPIVGGRTDLARKIDSKMLGSRNLVYCDPETLIPLPRALRQQMLFDLYKQGIISLSEYKNRAPFAFIQDVYSGEAQQWSRAQTLNEVLTERWQELDQLAEQDPLLPFLPEQGVPVLWADNPVVHQSALMELILDDRKPWPLRRLALERYVIYQELATSQLGGQPDPATGMIMPPAPVPIEVIGAPAELPRKLQASSPPRTAGGLGLPPGTPGTTLAAPESSGAALPLAAQQQAEPLGSYGSIEKALSGGQQLEQ